MGTAISAGYGFICGAYMPISMFGKGLGHVLSFLPGTYGTSLVRNHTLAGVFAEMQSLGWSDEVLVGIRDSVDCNLYFFGHAVSVGAMYGILCVTVALLIGVYVLLHMFWGKRKTVLRGKKSK